jgi:hypothetical protein
MNLALAISIVSLQDGFLQTSVSSLYLPNRQASFSHLQSQLPQSHECTLEIRGNDTHRTKSPLQDSFPPVDLPHRPYLPYPYRPQPSPFPRPHRERSSRWHKIHHLNLHIHPPTFSWPECYLYIPSISVSILPNPWLLRKTCIDLQQPIYISFLYHHHFTTSASIFGLARI